jgi:hypothetical protein
MRGLRLTLEGNASAAPALEEEAKTAFGLSDDFCSQEAKLVLIDRFRSWIDQVLALGSYPWCCISYTVHNIHISGYTSRQAFCQSAT